MGQRNSGTEYEREMAKLLDLDLVAGSGNQWHSKLDLKGRLTRWSLKFTEKDRFSLRQADIDEARSATLGLQGDGKIPLMLIRLGTPEYDLVVMGLDDFLALQSGDIELLPEFRPKSAIRKERAKIPELFRRENASD